MSAVVRSFKWFYHEFGLASIHETGRNAYFIILARTLRMFAYGTNSLILAIFFAALDWSDHEIGAFMTLTLFGDLLLGTFLTLIADRVGRRNVLLGGSTLMVTSGLVFAIFEKFWILLLAAIFGVISVTGGDFGPFRSIEESVISQLTTGSTRSDVLAWYITLSTLGSSIGSEASGRIVYYLQSRPGWNAVDAYHALFWLYTATGLINIVLTLLLSDACELKPSQKYAQIAQDENDDQQEIPAQHESVAVELKPTHITHKATSWLKNSLSQISAPTRRTMYKLWFLLAVDSLADGMVPYSLTNYYLDIKFHPSKSTLGDVQSISYFLGAIGALFAGPLAHRIGLINTMVFTHVPSSAAVLVFAIPPYFWMSAGLLFLRAGLNNMDQAPRTAFIAAGVKSEERTAVMGITAMLRTLAALPGPMFTGFLSAGNKFWIAFVLAGTCRLAYDFGLYAMFVNMKIDQNEKGSGNATSRDHDEEDSWELHSVTDSDSDLSDEVTVGSIPKRKG